MINSEVGVYKSFNHDSLIEMLHSNEKKMKAVDKIFFYMLI